MKNKSNSINQSWHFQDLMLYRVHEILLIASPYDAYILEQDGVESNIYKMKIL